MPYARSDAWTPSVGVSSGPTSQTRTDDVLPRMMAVPVPMFMLAFESALSGAVAVSAPAEQSAAVQPDVVLPAETADEPSVPPETADEPPATAGTADEPPELPVVAEGSGGTSRHRNKIDLIIDSLPRYHLIEPIPVTVESLGDQVFTATVRDLDISTSGNTVGDALLSLKEQIESIYEDVNKKSHLDDNQRRFAEFFDSHISMERQVRQPSWYHRR
jgi:hypothetical protein